MLSNSAKTASAMNAVSFAFQCVVAAQQSCPLKQLCFLLHCALCCVHMSSLQQLHLAELHRWLQRRSGLGQMTAAADRFSLNVCAHLKKPDSLTRRGKGEDRNSRAHFQCSPSGCGQAAAAFHHFQAAFGAQCQIGHTRLCARPPLTQCD